MAQPKTYIVPVVAIVLGVVVGWVAGGQAAYQRNQSYTEQMLKDARFAQAKERASLAQLLEKGEFAKAKELVYVVLGGNFKDYVGSSDAKQRTEACELLERLKDDFKNAQATTDQALQSSRQMLVDQIRAATDHCTKRSK